MKNHATDSFVSMTRSFILVPKQFSAFILIQINLVNDDRRVIICFIDFYFSLRNDNKFWLMIVFLVFFSLDLQPSFVYCELRFLRGD